MDDYMYFGKRIDNGEIVKGYLIVDNEHSYRIVESIDYSTGTYIDTGHAPRVLPSSIKPVKNQKNKNLC